MAAPYLLSKSLDPIFAISIGVAAAAVRINREEKAKGHSTGQTLEALRRRVGMAADEIRGKGEGKAGERTGG